ncbi:MAG: carnitine dehydratase, partial [Thermoleophilia bacterium]
MYATADGRFLTVAALEEKFFRRLCQILGLPHLASRQYDPASQEEIGEALSRALATRSLDEWLQLFDGEDVCVGPVWTL